MNSYETPNMKILLDLLVKNSYIKTNKVYNSMLEVDRGDFTDSEYAYYDQPNSIKYKATISAPHMHAFALEYLNDYLQPGYKVLDVGSGSVAFSKMMSDQGVVFGIEHIPELYELGIKNISKSHLKLLEDKIINLVEGDGRLGVKDKAPFNCIHVGAAAEKIPDNLIDQLANGGRMMIPVGGINDNQYICIVDKDSKGYVTKRNVLSVRYVPLTDKNTQLYG